MASPITQIKSESERTNTAEPEHSSGWCINVLIGPDKMEILGKMTASDARRVSACAGHFTIERVPLATMRPTIVLTLLLLTLVTTQACSGGAPTQEALETAVVAALDTLVAELVAERPADAAAYTERLRAYLEAHPAFYGSAAALLDEAGAVTASPYVYRTADGYQTLDLALPHYNIEAQE